MRDLKATKQYKNKEYTWWPKHGMWTVHKPEECELPGTKGDNVKENKEGKSNKNMAKALLAMQTDEDSTSKVYYPSGW